MKISLCLAATLISVSVGCLADPLDDSKVDALITQYESSSEGPIRASADYKMENLRKKHVFNGQEFTLDVDEAADSWSGSGAGIESSSGHIECDSSCPVMVLKGTAIVKVPDGTTCEHDLTIRGLPNNEILLRFSGHKGPCTGHGDGSAHPGIAHGSD